MNNYAGTHFGFLIGSYRSRAIVSWFDTATGTWPAPHRPDQRNLCSVLLLLRSNFCNQATDHRVDVVLTGYNGTRMPHVHVNGHKIWVSRRLVQSEIISETHFLFFVLKSADLKRWVLEVWVSPNRCDFNPSGIVSECKCGWRWWLWGSSINMQICNRQSHAVSSFFNPLSKRNLWKQLVLVDNLRIQEGLLYWGLLQHWGCYRLARQLINTSCSWLQAAGWEIEPV